MKKINLNSEEKVTLALIIVVSVVAIIAVIIKIIIDFIPEKVYYAKHILVEDKKTAIEVIEKLDNGYGFCELVEEYSIDAIDKCGYVGKFKKGEMVEEFEKATKKLKYNEYTKKPIKTEYGYHIILRIKSEVKSSVDNDEQINEESNNNVATENEKETNSSTSSNQTNTNNSSNSNSANNSSNSNSNNNSKPSSPSNSKTEKTIDATKEYYCIEPFRLNGTKCEHYLSSDALTRYYCTSGTLNGTVCKTSVKITLTSQAKSWCANNGLAGSGNCPSIGCGKVGGIYDSAEYSKNSSSLYWCYKWSENSAAAKSEYYCPDGYTLNYNKCEKYYVTDAPFKLKCPSGYDLVGTTCKK